MQTHSLEQVKAEPVPDVKGKELQAGGPVVLHRVGQHSVHVGHHGPQAPEHLYRGRPGMITSLRTGKRGDCGQGNLDAVPAMASGSTASISNLIILR